MAVFYSGLIAWSDLKTIVLLSMDLNIPVTHLAAGMAAVSYTHLDVYKRQVPASVMRYPINNDVHPHGMC